jgi:hypothetical protein
MLFFGAVTESLEMMKSKDSSDRFALIVFVFPPERKAFFRKAPKNNHLHLAPMRFNNSRQEIDI